MLNPQNISFYAKEEKMEKSFYFKHAKRAKKC